MNDPRRERGPHSKGADERAADETAPKRERRLARRRDVAAKRAVALVRSHIRA